MMKKRRNIIIAAAVCCLLLVSFLPAQAQSGLTVSDSSVEADFPDSLTFTVSARSDADITDIRLNYRVNRTSFARVTSQVLLEFDPARQVEADWRWDMRKTGGLPPGTSVIYWWTVQNADGSHVETPPAEVEFNDERYPWRRLTENEVTMFWYQGEESFARGLMDAAHGALDRLEEDTGAVLDKGAEMYIYADSADLQGAMIFPQEWTGGVAYTRYGKLAIGIAPDDLDWGTRTIAHELTHLVVHQVTLNPYGDIPTWLDEGLAMHNEGEPQAVFDSVLDRAVEDGDLISVRSLASPFSAETRQSLLSYAQSNSIVDYLLGEYGQDDMLELLNIFGEGSGYDDALMRVYGFDMDGLNTRWVDWVTAETIPVGGEGSEYE